MSWYENLLQMKVAADKTTEEISASANISKSTLDKLFAGRTKDPQLSTISAVVHALGFTLDDLESDTDKKTVLMFRNGALNQSEAQDLVKAILDTDPIVQRSLYYLSMNFSHDTTHNLQRKVAEVDSRIEARINLSQESSDGVQV